MGQVLFNDTGDQRYDELPDGFVSAEPRPKEDGTCTFLLEPTKIPTEHLAAVAERMGITLQETKSGITVTFPAPYSQVLRLQWCTNVRKLAIHHDVDWPHLRDV